MSPGGNRVSPHIARNRIYQFSMALATVALSAYLINVFSVQGLFGVMVIMAPVTLGLWAYWARERWWVVMPIATSFGGLFYFGFRIYVYEMALVACLLGLLPVLAVTKMKSERRSPIPIAVFLLLGYLALHLLVSEYLWYTRFGKGGVGNILRVYMRALWPLLFLILFQRFGTTKYLKLALYGMYVAAATRVLLGLAGYFAPQVLYIPFVNLILPGIWSQGIDLRQSTVMLVSLSFCLASISKRPTVRLLHFATIPVAIWLILLGGSRIALGKLAAIALLWTFFQRKYILLATFAFALTCSMIVFNANPRLIYKFPTRAQRTLSILILRSDTRTVQAHRVVEGSNQWHFGLMKLGAERWKASARSFLFGNALHGFDYAFYGRSASMAQRADMAAKIGSYEAAIWTVLAVLGITGAALYIAVGIALIRPIASALFRDGIVDVGHCFFFLAVSSAVIWATFSWIAGHFPGAELMLAALAKAAHDDMLSGPTDSREAEGSSLVAQDAV